MEFHRVYHAINEFCTADLSATYLDLLKDRIYTFAPNDPARRSAQTALWRITEALVRLTAPYLSFTAEEVWTYLPTVKGREPSVHLALFPRLEDLSPAAATDLLADWAQLLSVRDDVLKSLEEARKEKRIGKALEAKVRLEIPAGLQPLLQKYQSSLKELFNVSQVEFADATGPDALQVITLPADGTKCARCWNYSTHVGENQQWPTVCERCVAALEAIGVAGGVQ